MSKRITKVKVKDGKVEILLSENHGKVEKETVFRCSELPHPDLNLAFSALESEVRDILEFDKVLGGVVWPGKMEVIGVSWSYSETADVEGATITALVRLDTTNSPLVINTPHLPFGQYSDQGNQPVMDDFGIRKLEKLRAEAQKYMDGKRAQAEMPGVAVAR